MGNDTLRYEATVSGRSYEDEDYPKLDTIKFSLRGFYTKEDKVITNTIISPQKPSKWAISPSIGIGYGLTQKKFDAFVGISVSYKIK